MNADTPPVTPSPAPPAAATGPVPRRLAVPAAVLAAVAGAFAYVGAVDPNEPGHYPVCPLLRSTGLYCPGCGGLRSAHAFVHGDLVTALHANAAAVLGFLAFAVLWTVWVVRVLGKRPVRLDPGPVVPAVSGLLLLVFTVVRNLPFGGWLHP
ncbi:membrane protein [Streptomyces minutiscleroticus]|uniref:Membrane protein n=1 Tax=Streptomyces minutiscleroticus TaxID=68238 RepID=A0A918N9M6_9ACTN|nr:membrane protein [Streptomyces minutiscleroticus]